MARAGQWRRSVKQLLVAMAVLAVAALAAGWLFGRGDAPSAARLLLSEEVDEQPLAEDAPGPDPDLPTSGPDRGTVLCGVVDAPVAPSAQVATLAAGVVILQHRPDLGDGEHATLREVAGEHERVLVAPSEHVGADVVATAWRHRFEPDDITRTRLERFVVGWSGRGPDPAACP